MALLDQYKNLALATIATAPSPATSGTSLVVTAGQAAYLPAPPFNATVFDAKLLPTPGNAEIVRVTAVAGDTLTIVRAQEGSTARTIVAGDNLAATFTVKFVADVTDAQNLTGTIADARLSATVARTNAANTFTQNQQINKATPVLDLYDTLQPVDARRFRLYNDAQHITVEATADAGASQGVPLQLFRDGRVGVGTDLYEKGRATALGHWIDVPFNASNFYCYGGTWTVTSGQVSLNRYTLVGRTLLWTVAVIGSSVAALDRALISLPTGVAKGYGGAGTCVVRYGTGAYATVPMWVDPFGNRLLITAQGGPTGTFDVYLTVSCEVN
jgi:hypothetical protein